MRWSKQDCERLITLKRQRDPKLTGDEIAAMFGVSRKAVVAKFARLTSKGAAQRKRKRAAPTRQTKLDYERNGERWTAEESADLVARVEAGELYPAIGRAINRTAWACKAQYAVLKRAGTASLSEADLARQAERAALEEAILRAQQQPRPASLTAWVFGDPLPGRSALDAKRAGIAR